MNFEEIEARVRKLELAHHTDKAKRTAEIYKKQESCRGNAGGNAGKNSRT